ncbi:hypothetical protein KIN20_009341 [Parelaphostrongylus tenuis]|uniref:Uncharacterized protein n=1 Tax=Parelaphostrongylus tenuis TaxID=148309 RepID=A0AAD5QI73_PARTN|nr:hypothetical protein KIN20_009341 [Parelaphostrongylus tenuis]
MVRSRAETHQAFVPPGSIMHILYRHASRRVLSSTSTAIRSSGAFSASDGATVGSTDDFEEPPVSQNPYLSLFSSPKIVVPTFDPVRRLGTFVSQTIYQLWWEKAYDKERFVRISTEGASLLGECIANGEWSRMEFLASKDLVEQAKLARRRCTKDQLNMLQFHPDDAILSFLHSSFISVRNFSRKYDHGIICIYFTTASFIRTTDSVPLDATITQLLNDFKDDVMILNVTFAQNLSPLGQWRATGINFFVPDAIQA